MNLEHLLRTPIKDIKNKNKYKNKKEFLCWKEQNLVFQKIKRMIFWSKISQIIGHFPNFKIIVFKFFKEKQDI